jgi:hypothetical protein
VPVAAKEVGLVVEVIIRMPMPLRMSGITHRNGLILTFSAGFGSISSLTIL